MLDEAMTKGHSKSGICFPFRFLRMTACQICAFNVFQTSSLCAMRFNIGRKTLVGQCICFSAFTKV